MDLYVEGKLSAQKDECLPRTKWVGNSSAEIKQDKEMIRHFFLKCGLSNSLDGSEDHEVKIKSIDGYKMPEPESEFHMVSESESEDEETDIYIEFETESRDSESKNSESSDEDDV